MFSVVTILAAVLTFLAPFVNPGRAWIFSILGLIAPAVYLATVIAALYWIIRWRWGWASVLLVLVVIGLWRVPLFLKPELRRTYGEPAYGRGTIGVMTYNVRGFYDEQGRNSADSVLRMIRETGPDIVCLQEFNGRLAGDRRCSKPCCRVTDALPAPPIPMPKRRDPPRLCSFVPDIRSSGRATW